jgi:hypothetical protein
VGGGANGRLAREQLEQRRDVQAVLVEAGDAAEDRLEVVLDGRGGAGEQRQVAESEAAGHGQQRHVQVGRAGGDEGERAPGEAHQVTAQEQAARLGVVLVSQRAVAADEVGAEVEQLQLLVVGIGGEHGGEVAHQPAPRRLMAHELEALPAVAGAGDEGRHGREQGDEGDERAQPGQERHHREEGQHGADEAEQAGDHLDRPEARLALRLLELVVEAGRLEHGEVEPGGVLHHQELDADRHALLEELLGGVGERAQQAGAEGEAERGGGEQHDALDVGGSLAAGDRLGHRVDEQLAEPDLAGWHGAAQQGQRGQDEGEAAVRAPDQRQHLPRGAERAPPGQRAAASRGRRTRRMRAAIVVRRAVPHSSFPSR